jgi:hypothetical protein
MALNMKIAASWDMILYSLVDKYQHFVGTCSFNLQGRGSKEDGSSLSICLSIRLHSVTSQETVILFLPSYPFLNFTVLRVSLVQ